MSDEMSHPVTKGELREILADYPTKQLVDDMAKTFLAALERLDAKIDDGFRNMNALVEAVRAEVRAITEPFQDHGPRIARLERAVFPEDGGVRAKARVRRRTSKR